MKISKLEIERFINAFKEYRETQDSSKWLANRTYLSDNGFEHTDLLELLHEEDTEKLVKILEVLEVEVC